jgi:hypothetical protein
LAAAVDVDDDDWKVMLVTSSYTPDQFAHSRRDDITNEVTGTGYTAGGATCTGAVTRNDGAGTITITFGSVNWPSSTVTAAGAVYYKSRGGASSADEIAVFNDFEANVSSSSSTFTVAATTITINNPIP